MFLLSTDVLWELRRRDRSPVTARWLEAQRTADLYLSAGTVSEIEHSIVREREFNPVFAQELARWLDQVLAWYGDHVLPVDIPTARRWGQLSAIHTPSGADLLIAATALEHGLTLVTDNPARFESTGVSVLNPLDSEHFTA